MQGKLSLCTDTDLLQSSCVQLDRVDRVIDIEEVLLHLRHVDVRRKAGAERMCIT